MWLSRLALGLLLVGHSTAMGQAVLVEEGRSSSRATFREAKWSGDRTRRVGVGVVGSGLSGVAGLNFEVNFTRQTGFLAGYGVSTDFNSLFFGLKRILTGERFLPYVSGGYARWFAAGQQREVGRTTPGFVGDRFLSESERSKGVFAKNLAFAGLGLQYVQLSGDWAGTSVYFEGLALLNVNDVVVAPTTGLGFIYYF